MMRKVICILLLCSSLLLTACAREAQHEHEEPVSQAYETGYASGNFRTLNLSKSPAIEALEKQTGKEIDTSAPAKTASEKYYEEHPDRRYSNPYATDKPNESITEKPIEENVAVETNNADLEQEKAGTGWRGLSFAEYITSLLMTLIVYGLFPFLFSRLRGKNITAKKYRIWCYAVNILWFFFFVLLKGKGNSAAYVIWTSVFAYNGVRHLTKKGLIEQRVQSKD